MSNTVYHYNRTKNHVHNECFPETFRALIVGQSGAGKTALLMKMLLEPDLLNYDKLYIFARSLYQPEYQVLENGFKYGLSKKEMISMLNSAKTIEKHDCTIEDLALGLQELNKEKDEEPNHIEAEFHDNADNIPDPKDLDKNVRNLIIFDDIMTDRNQVTPENYYTRGRSANCDCIYLSQNYTRLPLHTIRSNSNFMIFFKSSPRVVNQLFTDFASNDMSIDDFRKFCNNAWTTRVENSKLIDKKYGYIVIDLSRSNLDEKYRENILLLNKDI